MVGEDLSGLGLRERKKHRVRHDIMKAAVALFEQQGYDETSIEEIAARAEVSPSTFFRYFPTKEAVLLGPDDALLRSMLEHVEGAFRLRPDISGLAEGFVEFARTIDDSQDDLSRRQARLMATSETVQARAALGQMRWERELAERLAVTAGRTRPDLTQEVLAAMAIGAYSVAVRRYRKQRKESLASLVDASFRELAGIIDSSSS